MVGQAQAGGQQAVVGSAGIEDLGQAVGSHPVGLDAQRAPRRQGDGLAQASGTRSPQLLQESDGPPGVGPDFIHAGLLAVEFLDDHQGEHHLVLLETQRGHGVGEEDTGVENVGAGLDCGDHLSTGSQAGGREARIIAHPSPRGVRARKPTRSPQRGKALVVLALAALLTPLATLPAGSTTYCLGCLPP